MPVNIGCMCQSTAIEWPCDSTSWKGVGGVEIRIFGGEVASLGGLHLKPLKFEHIFVAVITFPPFFCADTFDTSLLLIVCALR